MSAKDFREELRASEYRELMHHVSNELDNELAESHHAGIATLSLISIHCRLRFCIHVYDDETDNLECRRIEVEEFRDYPLLHLCYNGQTHYKWFDKWV